LWAKVRKKDQKGAGSEVHRAGRLLSVDCFAEMSVVSGQHPEPGWEKPDCIQYMPGRSSGHGEVPEKKESPRKMTLF